VLQGTIKILKRDIATFTEDDNIGLDKIGKPRADAIKPEPETSGKGPDASDDEKAAITKLRNDLKAQLEKLGKGPEARMKDAELSVEERQLVDEKIGHMQREGGKSNTMRQVALTEVTNLSPKSKAVKVLLDLLTGRDTVKASAAQGLADVASDADAKWMAFKLDAPTRLLGLLEDQGDELAGKSRQAANAALERLTEKSIGGWPASEDAFRSQAEAEAAPKWRPLVTEAVTMWQTEESKKDEKRKKIEAKLKLLDSPNWRDAFVDEDAPPAGSGDAKGGDSKGGGDK
jgi:hypothetical protein